MNDINIMDHYLQAKEKGVKEKERVVLHTTTAAKVAEKKKPINIPVVKVDPLYSPINKSFTDDCRLVPLCLGLSSCVYCCVVRIL